MMTNRNLHWIIFFLAITCMTLACDCPLFTVCDCIELPANLKCEVQSISQFLILDEPTDFIFITSGEYTGNCLMDEVCFASTVILNELSEEDTIPLFTKEYQLCLPDVITETFTFEFGKKYNIIFKIDSNNEIKEENENDNQCFINVN